MPSKIDQVLNDFKDLLEEDKEDYTLKELSGLLETAYKKSFKVKNSKPKSDSDVKKEPSAYNIFVKNEITKIKAEKMEGVDPKDYMKIAAQRWQEQKLVKSG